MSAGEDVWELLSLCESVKRWLSHIMSHDRLAVIGAVRNRSKGDLERMADIRPPQPIFIAAWGV